jgi:hypothetical protein
MLDLTLRHLWTETGAPITWRVTDDDERELRGLLRRLDEWKADPEMRSAVLLAAEEDGTLVGAWSREGTSDLGDLIDGDPQRSEGLMRMRHALRDGVTGP